MSKSVSPKSIHSVFENSELIKRLRQQTKKSEGVQQFIHSFMDPELAAKIIVAKWEHDELVLLAESPAWAAKIRYLVPLMLDNFARNNTFNSIKSIRIRNVTYDRLEVDSHILPKHPPSSQALETINNFAESIEDEALSNALKRLAKTTGGKSN